MTGVLLTSKLIQEARDVIALTELAIACWRGFSRVRADDLSYGDRFRWCGRLWQHCGWYSAAWHIAATCLENGEQCVIGNSDLVEPFYDEYIYGGGI